MTSTTFAGAGTLRTTVRPLIAHDDPAVEQARRAAANHLESLQEEALLRELAAAQPRIRRTMAPRAPAGNSIVEYIVLTAFVASVALATVKPISHKMAQRFHEITVVAVPN